MIFRKNRGDCMLGEKKRLETLFEMYNLDSGLYSYFKDDMVAVEQLMLKQEFK